MTDITIPPHSSQQIARPLVTFLVAAASAFVLGGVTSYWQTVLPDALRPFANSSGGWTMLVFLVVYLSRFRRLGGALLGLVSFELLLVGYAVVSTWRGFAYSVGGTFTLLALVAGPVIGVAAALARRGADREDSFGVAVLAAVLVGEGVWALLTVAGTTGATYWVIQIVLGAVFLGASLARRRDSLLRSTIVVLLSVTGSALVLGGYAVVFGIGPS